MMKVLEKDLKHGRITLVPELLDDFWTLYNIIQRGDLAYAKTTREVRLGDRYEKPEKGKRISLTLGLRVERVVWDRSLNRLRVHGIVCDAPEDIGALGSHHTLNITLNTPITIVKERWLEYQLEQINRASSRGVAPLVIIAIDDEGYCIAVLRGFGPDIIVEENISLPGKHMEQERTRIINVMFKSASKSLKDVVESTGGSIVIIGVGFIKNNFLSFLRENMPELLEKVIDVKSVNSAGKAGIYEALRSGILARALKHARMIEEAIAVEEILRRLGMGRSDAIYGLSEVKRAASLGAIEELLVADELLRDAGEEEMKILEDLMLEVEGKGGRIKIISVEHEAGAKLKSLGGVAALLRFPIS
ncbi:MAG: mRNA surveillance protein pelota [Candidatus Bathyarchaeia archaeon]|nr:mRNA surveillance protein pelota [Candidatus Bathyarchaeota archaeon]